ncbi:GNAT family N-acetyltransferase [Tichowtungia aerotolerans]|uniref:GNAT family N-acetyltransferase n=2 Tax=Tichowtungia aerotolerans TaxID=2697043 RepID=A0A6P1MH32_9BACT|nr:GNAT family N-acetyltransferase [Tichowtungia aerotolerans]
MRGLSQDQTKGADDCWIRAASHEDVRAMTRLLQELFAVETEFEFDEEKQRCGLEMLLDSPTAGIWVVDRRGWIVGMVTIQLVVSTAEGALSGWVEDLVVSSAYRRRGLGRALLKSATNWAKRQGATRVQLLADSRNVPALMFYRKQEWLQTNMIALRCAAAPKPTGRQIPLVFPAGVRRADHPFLNRSGASGFLSVQSERES